MKDLGYFFQMAQATGLKYHANVAKKQLRHLEEKKKEAFSIGIQPHHKKNKRPHLKKLKQAFCSN